MKANQLFENNLVWLAEGSSFHKQNQEVVPFGLKHLDNALPLGGLSMGAIHEWHGKQGAPLSILAHIAGTVATSFQWEILWVDEAVWPSPHYLRDIDPSGALVKNSLFIAAETAKKKRCGCSITRRGPKGSGP